MEIAPAAAARRTATHAMHARTRDAKRLNLRGVQVAHRMPTWRQHRAVMSAMSAAAAATTLPVAVRAPTAAAAPAASAAATATHAWGRPTRRRLQPLLLIRKENLELLHDVRCHRVEDAHGLQPVPRVALHPVVAHGWARGRGLWLLRLCRGCFETRRTTSRRFVRLLGLVAGLALTVGLGLVVGLGLLRLGLLRLGLLGLGLVVGLGLLGLGLIRLGLLRRGLNLSRFLVVSNRHGTDLGGDGGDTIGGRRGLGLCRRGLNLRRSGVVRGRHFRPRLLLFGLSLILGRLDGRWLGCGRSRHLRGRFGLRGFGHVGLGLTLLLVGRCLHLLAAVGVDNLDSRTYALLGGRGHRRAPRGRLRRPTRLRHLGHLPWEASRWAGPARTDLRRHALHVPAGHAAQRRRLLSGSAGHGKHARHARRAGEPWWHARHARNRRHARHAERRRHAYAAGLDRRH